MASIAVVGKPSPGRVLPTTAILVMQNQMLHQTAVYRHNRFYPSGRVGFYPIERMWGGGTFALPKMVYDRGFLSPEPKNNKKATN